MAVRSKEEIIEKLTATIGESTSDEAIALLEDVNDTFGALTGSNGDGKDWKAEAERIDKEWREKYVARFKSGSSEEDDNIGSQGGEKKDYTFDKLFSVKE